MLLCVGCDVDFFSLFDMRLSGHSDPSLPFGLTRNLLICLFFLQDADDIYNEIMVDVASEATSQSALSPSTPGAGCESRNTQEKEGLGCGSFHPYIGCLDGLAVRLLVPCLLDL